MAYDDELAGRVRELLSDRDDAGDISEKSMFGSLCFLLAGNLAICVREDELLVRLDPENAELAAEEDGVRVAEMGSRRMKGWVFVGPERLTSDDELASWVDSGADRAASLPAKE